jgi:hypothetical protein
VIRKFFLHVSRKEQRKRFLERIDEPSKNWKFALSDVQERQHWKDYMRAYEDAIRETATREAPWFVVPADRKWFTRIVVAAAVVEALALHFPKGTRGSGRSSERRAGSSSGSDESAVAPLSGIRRRLILGRGPLRLEIQPLRGPMPLLPSGSAIEKTPSGDTISVETPSSPGREEARRHHRTCGPPGHGLLCLRTHAGFESRVPLDLREQRHDRAVLRRPSQGEVQQVQESADRAVPQARHRCHVSGSSDHLGHDPAHLDPDHDDHPSIRRPYYRDSAVPADDQHCAEYDDDDGSRRSFGGRVILHRWHRPVRHVR